MSYLKKAIKGSMLVFFFTLVAAVMGYLLRILLARNLTTVEFGLFYSIYSLTLFISIFNNLGTGQALAKIIPEFLVKKRKKAIKTSILSVFLITFLLSIVTLFILVASSGFLATHFFHNENAQFLLILFSFVFILRPLNSVISYIFQGFQEMSYYALIDPLRTFFILLITFIGFIYVKTAVVPIIAYLVTPVIIFAFYLPILFKKILPDFADINARFDPKTIRYLFKIGIPLMLITIGVLILNYTDVLMLTYFSGLEQVALYNAVLPTVTVLGYFSIALSAVLLPMSSELWTKGHLVKLRQGMQLLYNYSFIIIIPLALVMFSFPEIILNVLFGKQFVPAANALRILSISTIFLTINNINLTSLSGVGKPKVSSRIILSAALFNVCTNFILIPRFGMIGAAITTLASNMLIVILSAVMIRKIIDTGVCYKKWIQNLVLGVFFVLLIYFLKKWISLNPYIEAFIVLSISALLYITILFALRIISVKELKILLKAIRR